MADAFDVIVVGATPGSVPLDDLRSCRRLLRSTCVEAELLAHGAGLAVCPSPRFRCEGTQSAD
jgi:hypothetical protein